MKFVGFDTETHLIGAGAVLPKLVCLTLCEDGELKGHAACEPELKAEMLRLLQDPEVVLVAHNAAYDLGVLVNYDFELWPYVIAALEAGRIKCTQVAEKLITLSTTGDLEFVVAPNGDKSQKKYSLAALVMDYEGVDLSADKDDDDAWRLRYNELDGIPFSQYPPKAAEYALLDARWPLIVAEHQQNRTQGTYGFASINPDVETLRNCTAFALQLITAWGIGCDLDARDKLIEWCEDELSPEKLAPLIEAGILRPGSSPQVHKNQQKRALELCPSGEFDRHREMLEAEGVKFTAEKKPSIDTKKLQSRFEWAGEEFGIELQMTPAGKYKTDREAQQAFYGIDPVLTCYADRQSLQKLVSTELPAMSAPVIHPNFDVLKATGRISSYGSGKKPLYPSTNIQQKDPRARHCYIPRDGCVFLSADYDYLELCSLAWRLNNLFGHESVLARVINNGLDPHAYLGSILALHLDGEYAKAVAGMDQDQNYAYFKSLEETAPDFYKHFRTFAKPTGLGYPGGLGAATFITFAKVTYGVDLVKLTGSYEAALALAEQLREIWFTAFPEMRPYFDWVQKDCVDPNNSTPDKRLYAYQSPLGMYRAGCTFTAAVNGCGLQTPSAEGFMLSMWEVQKACYSPGHQLFGCRIVAPIHDELLLEVPDDAQLHDRAVLIQNLMVSNMSRMLPGVRIGVEPCAMRRWSKKAKPVFDQNGRLVPWVEKEAA